MGAILLWSVPTTSISLALSPWAGDLPAFDEQKTEDHLTTEGAEDAEIEPAHLGVLGALGG